MTNSSARLVAIIDADMTSRESVNQLIQQAGHATRSYRDHQSFVADVGKQDGAIHCVCVVSDFLLAQGSTVAFAEQLEQDGLGVAMVYFVAEGRIRDAVHAMRRGAIAYLEKADGPHALLPYVEEGLERSHARFVRRERNRQTALQLNELSGGERMVLRGIMGGMLNKEIAQALTLSIRTIEQRRREIFLKLNVQHPATLASKVTELILMQRETGFPRDPAFHWIKDIRLDGPVDSHYLRGPHHSGFRVTDRIKGNGEA